ncbi:hypothetical protein HQ585_13100 [candidate division KSB1 bacterium]|nr:hypothetical protein [candidate division KSB1 bacterium]
MGQFYTKEGVDTDNDGLLDIEEDVNGNGLLDLEETDFRNPDTDNDGLSDGEEINKYRTDPLRVESDGDGLYDSFEAFEADKGETKDFGVQIILPNNRATRGGEIFDRDIDSDGDGLTNIEEQDFNYYARNLRGLDLFKMCNPRCTVYSPYLADTDNNGVNDGDEDFDGDGVENQNDPL